MHHKGIVLLGAGRLQQPIIEAAKRLGIKTFVFDALHHEDAVNIADHYFKVSIHAPQEIIATLKKENIEPSLVATVGTDFSTSVAEINQYFNLPGITIAQAAVLSHKGKMREFFQDSEVLQPAFTIGTLKSKEKLYDWVHQYKNKDGYVIKPVDNMGARGVMFLPDETYLSYAVEFAARYSKTGEIILEHYVPAHELSVDALVANEKIVIRGIADRHIERRDNHFFIENGHTMPAENYNQLFDPIEEILKKIASKLVSLSGHYLGALKLDLRHTNGGELVLGEVAGRLSGGFMSTHTYPSATGHDLLSEYIELLQSKGKLSMKKETYSGFSIERSISGLLGQITESNLSEVTRKYTDQGNLVDFHLSCETGQIVSPLQSNVGKQAHFIFKAETELAAQKQWEQVRNEVVLETAWPSYNDKEIKRIARKKFAHESCWVCKTCDGAHCASSVPGMGALGKMLTFQDNIQALQEYQLTPRYFSEFGDQEFEDCSWRFLGNEFSAPILTAPISGSITNMGSSISEYDYALETAEACAYLNLLPTFGDGASADKFWTGLHAIAQAGRGFPVFKPRKNQDDLKMRILAAEQKGALAWAMDIDGIHFKTMQLKNQQTARKSVSELQELSKASSLPFLLKGIMTIEDAKLAIEAGAYGIIVSNHGGRVLDNMPGTARVLPEIAAFVKQEKPTMQILVDGGVRSGQDVYKMLSLGADAVLIGRPVTIAAVAQGRFAVAAYLKNIIEELKDTMRVMGCSKLADIQSDSIRIKAGTPNKHEKSIP